MKISLRIVGTAILVIAVVEFFRSASLALGINSSPHASNTALVVAGVCVLVGILVLVVSLFTDYFTLPSYYHAKAYSHRDRPYTEREYSERDYRDYRKEDSTSYDPYYILDLSKGATDEEVKTRFRDLSRKYHSDTAGVKGTDHLFNEVQKAYKTICKERGL